MTPNPSHTFISVLEKHPEHVRALGMIIIEVTNLEHAMGTLVAAILNIPEELGHVIYLTPKSAFGRLETFENIVEYLLIENSQGAARLNAIAKRAKAILGKR